MQVVLEALEGVVPFVEDELAATTPSAEIVASEPTEVRVEVDDPVPLLGLRTVVAGYAAVDLDIRRPRALLSPDHLHSCLGAIAAARRTAKPARFASFRLSAAGSDSPELQRFRAEIERQTGLRDDPIEGDMLVRLRRSPGDTPAPRPPQHRPTPPQGRSPGGEDEPADPSASTWQLLVRLTPRPLSARPWRVANYPGALNATIAAAVVATTDPTPQDRFIDLMCGSGTLVIERLARGRPARLAAVDISDEALEATRANQRAAKFRGKVELLQEDARELAGPLGRLAPAGDVEPGFDRLVVNLPWGELVGDHATNSELYRAVLREASALAASDATLCVLTHDIRRFERCLADVGIWAVEDTWRFFQKGHRPKLYRLVQLTK